MSLDGPKPRRRVAFIGDSFVAGVGDPTGWAGSGTSYLNGTALG